MKTLKVIHPPTIPININQIRCVTYEHVLHTKMTKPIKKPQDIPKNLSTDKSPAVKPHHQPTPIKSIGTCYPQNVVPC